MSAFREEDNIKQVLIKDITVPTYFWIIFGLFLAFVIFNYFFEEFLYSKKSIPVKKKLVRDHKETILQGPNIGLTDLEIETLNNTQKNTYIGIDTLSLDKEEGQIIEEKNDNFSKLWTQYQSSKSWANHFNFGPSLICPSSTKDISNFNFLSIDRKLYKTTSQSITTTLSDSSPRHKLLKTKRRVKFME